MASGLSIGLSIGLGGIAAVALGALADSVDLEAAMYAARPRRSLASRSRCCCPRRARDAASSPSLSCSLRSHVPREPDREFFETWSRASTRRRRPG